MKKKCLVFSKLIIAYLNNKLLRSKIIHQIIIFKEMIIFVITLKGKNINVITWPNILFINEQIIRRTNL